MVANVALPEAVGLLVGVNLDTLLETVALGVVEVLSEGVVNAETLGDAVPLPEPLLSRELECVPEGVTDVVDVLEMFPLSEPLTETDGLTVLVKEPEGDGLMVELLQLLPVTLLVTVLLGGFEFTAGGVAQNTVMPNWSVKFPQAEGRLVKEYVGEPVGDLELVPVALGDRLRVVLPVLLGQLLVLCVEDPVALCDSVVVLVTDKLPVPQKLALGVGRALRLPVLLGLTVSEDCEEAVALLLLAADLVAVAQALADVVPQAVALAMPEVVLLTEAQEVEEGEMLAVVEWVVVPVVRPVKLKEVVAVMLLEVLTVGLLEAVAVTLPVVLPLPLTVLIAERVEQALVVGENVVHIVLVGVLLTDVVEDTVPPARRLPVEQAVFDATIVPALEVLALALLLPEIVCAPVGENAGETLGEPENVWLLLLDREPPPSASQGLTEPVPEVHSVSVGVGE